MTSLYQLKGLRFGYDASPLFNIAEVSFAERAICALIGENGAGKSTLLRLLAFLQAPDSGTLYFLGDPVCDENRARYRHQVGLVPQNPYLLRGTVAYNIALGMRFRGIPRKHRLHRCQTVIDRLQLAAIARRPVSALSGGEGQKVALACILALQPKVLLLDEPFTWLDAGYVQELAVLMRGLCREEGVSILYTSHDSHAIGTVSDCVYALADGTLSRIR